MNEDKPVYYAAGPWIRSTDQAPPEDQIIMTFRVVGGVKVTDFEKGYNGIWIGTNVQYVVRPDWWAITYDPPED